MDNNSSRFHNMFTENWDALGSSLRDDMVEGWYGEQGTATALEIIGQLLMETFSNHNLDTHPTWGSEGKMLDATAGQFTREQKARLVTLADVIGPDYCQALYHAAVFMTKVA